MFATVKLLALLMVFRKASASRCGYQACHLIDPNKLNVHIIAHSHNELGWLETVDEYYFGKQYSVQDIITSVMYALEDNPNRKYIQVETAYFWRWWKQQNFEMRNLVRKLVKEGQLEIAGGGWSIPDEAVTHYQSIIDQFTLGFGALRYMLGDCGRPKVGWQIDSFGHSSQMAAIFASLGFDALFFTRLDYRDLKQRERTQSMELMWKGSPGLGADSSIFTSILKSYKCPGDFCWNIYSDNEPVVDNAESPLYNLDQMVEDFAKYIEEQRPLYKTPNILVPMGGDFDYISAFENYRNMDRLLGGFKRLKNDTYNVIYSTPACYAHAVRKYAKQKGLSFPTKTDDFTPYANWTGYYSTRPNLKRLERQGNNFLQVAKQLMVFAWMKGLRYNQDLMKLKEIMGIMQHHHAITGTHDEKVSEDYVKRMIIGFAQAEERISKVIFTILKEFDDSTTDFAPLRSCLFSNVSRCTPALSDQFLVAVYNPLSRKVSTFVRLPVPERRQYSVTGPEGPVVYDIAPAIDAFEEVPGLPAPWDLIFRAENVPPLGMKLYYIKKGKLVGEEPLSAQNETIGDDKIMLGFNPETGFLKNITVDRRTYPVSQQFMVYQPDEGTAIFRPDLDDAEPVADETSWTSFEGNLFYEVHQQFDPAYKQVIRYYKGENHVEFDWLVRPVPSSRILAGLQLRSSFEAQGVEVISHFATNLRTARTFYTDSNGRGLVKRIRNFRKTYAYTNEEPVRGNYYPVTSRIALKDGNEDVTFAVLTDRPEGGSSLRDGEVELMIHRSLTYDYKYAQPERVRGRHYLVVGSGESAKAAQHDVMQRKHLEPWIFVGELAEQYNLENLKSYLHFEFSGLLESLPPNVQILTLEMWNTNRLLLRLEHMFEEDGHPELSKPADVNLQDLFGLFEITYATEMTLGANQNLKYTKKQRWNNQRTNGTDRKNTHLTFTLHPMQIRTFLVKFKISQ